MTTTPLWPYTISPNSYAQQALTPQPTTQPVQAQATAAKFGPANQALYDALHAANLKQNAVPGLLAQYQANPAMAQQQGGLLAANPGQGIPLASNFYRLGQPTPQTPQVPGQPAAPGAAPVDQQAAQQQAFLAYQQAQADAAYRAQVAAYYAQGGGVSGGGDGAGASGGGDGSGAGGGSASP